VLLRGSLRRRANRPNRNDRSGIANHNCSTLDFASFASPNFAKSRCEEIPQP
jgi:hypothetical protein